MAHVSEPFTHDGHSHLYMSVKYALKMAVQSTKKCMSVNHTLKIGNVVANVQ